MLKEQFNDLNIYKVLYNSRRSIIYLLRDGRVFKRFHFEELEDYEKLNISLEGKILIGEKLKDLKEFPAPLSIVYQKDRLVGYTVKFNTGKPVADFVSCRKLNNFHFYVNFFNKLENIVKKGHSLGLVFPDLCTHSNIFISRMGHFSLIDYDGFQIEDYFSFSISSAIYNRYKILKPKFYNNGLFTEELDKYSLMILFLQFLSNLDLSSIDTINPEPNEILTTRDLADYINLDDEEIIKMIEDTLSIDREGIYVSNVVKAIASKYDLFVYQENNGEYARMLMKK